MLKKSRKAEIIYVKELQHSTIQNGKTAIFLQKNIMLELSQKDFPPIYRRINIRWRYIYQPRDMADARLGMFL